MFSLRDHGAVRHLTFSGCFEVLFFGELVLVALAVSHYVLSLGSGLYSHVVAEFDELFLDGVDHQLEHVKAFLCIGCCRILSAQSSEAYTAFELLHVVDVIHPFIIDYSDEYHALDLSDLVDADLFFLSLVKILEVFVKSVLETLLVHIVEHFLVEIQRLECRRYLCKSLVYSLEIPFLRIFGCNDYRVHDFVYQLMGHGYEIVSQILSEKDSLTLAVYYLTLLVHYIVVLQHVFSYGEVSAFDFLLCILYLLRYSPGFYSFVFLDAQTLYDGLHTLTAEQPHQFILHGDAELRAARVSLSSGTSSQLIVYPSRFMSLSTYYTKASQFSDFFLFFFSLLLILLMECLEFLSGFEKFRIVALDETCGERDGVGIISAGCHLTLRFEFRVSAQDDIGTSSGHVGCNRDSSEASCLCDDLGFLLMLLGVQHVEMLDAAFFQCIRYQL